jgi:hypothetical protein
MMNKTCISLNKHRGLWSVVTVAAMSPAYPTDIRGTFDSNEQRIQGTE